MLGWRLLLFLFSYTTGYSSPEWLQITKSVVWNFAIILVLPFLNNLKDPDPSDKMDLDFGIVLKEKNSVL